MAISPGRYNFTGGAFLGGDGTDLKRGDIKKFTLVCPRYNEETEVFEYDPLHGKSLYSTFLVLRRKGQVIASYQPITGTNPQAGVFDLPDSEQFVLRHSSMSAPFTDEEFTQCYDEMVAGHTVVVQYSSFGLAEAQLVRIDSAGALVFARCQGDMITTYTVSQNQPHNITIASNIIQDPDAKLNVTLGGVTKTYTPTGADLSVDIDAEVSRVYIAKGSANVATLNGGIAGIQNGWSYVLTDSGTLTDGNISVVAGDNVAWDGSAWFKVGNQVAVNALFIRSDAEYVFALVDSNDVILFAIKTDGSVTWPKGIPEFLQTLLDGKVDVVSGKTLVENQYANSAGSTSDYEFKYAIVDSNNKILFGVRRDGTVLTGIKIEGLQESKDGKTVIDEDFANSATHDVDYEFEYAITDVNGKVLFGIRRDGSFESPGLMAMISGDSGELASKLYVQSCVQDEQTRAETAEQALAESIANINPTVVIGGSNTPDNVFLETDGNNAITFKNISSTVYGYGVYYLKSTEDAKSVLEGLTKTIVKILLPINLMNQTVNLQSDVILDFCGGCIDNGSVVGNNTRVIFGSKCLGSNLSISGTWIAPYIPSSALIDSVSANALKLLCSFLSNSQFNILHLEPGSYTFTPLKNADKLITLKSNTKLIVDGSVVITPNGYTNYSIIRLDDIENVEITGHGQIVGDADYHDYVTTPSTHEWGMCINAAGVYNIHIHDITLKDATGDGIEISESGNRNPKRIKIERCNITHCGRQGISVTSGEQIEITQCRIDDIYRTLPMAAVDIEADVGHHVDCVTVSDLFISNCCGLMAIHADNVIFKNIKAVDCTRMFYAEDANYVMLECCSSLSDKSSSNFVEAKNDCSNVSLDNVSLVGTNTYVVKLNNILFNHTCNFGTASTVGSPVAGSTTYRSGKFIQFDGIDWVNFDGTPL